MSNIQNRLKNIRNKTNKEFRPAARAQSEKSTKTFKSDSLKTIVKNTKNIAENRLTALRKKLKNDLDHGKISETKDSQPNNAKTSSSPSSSPCYKSDFKVPLEDLSFITKKTKYKDIFDKLTKDCNNIQSPTDFQKTRSTLLRIPLKRNLSVFQNKLESCVASKKPTIEPSPMNKPENNCPSPKASHSLLEKRLVKFNKGSMSITCSSSSSSSKSSEDNDTKSVENMEWECTPESPSTTSQIEQINKNIAIVTDTNIFMHDLKKIQELLKLKLTGNRKLTIYVPWMVLQELDNLKDGNNLPKDKKNMALTAQKFINSQLLEIDSKLIGQTIVEVSNQQNIGKSADDKILSCCIQAKQKFDEVILLSSDINLCNKALVNELQACSPKDVIVKLKGIDIIKLKEKVQPLLSQIIDKCCKEVYGDICTQMDMLQNPPWSFDGCLKRFKRYWVSVFNDLLLKHCQKTVDQLIVLSTSGDDFKKLKNKIKELLFYLRDIEEFSEALIKLSTEVNEIYETI